MNIDYLVNARNSLEGAARIQDGIEYDAPRDERLEVLQIQANLVAAAQAAALVDIAESLRKLKPREAL